MRILLLSDATMCIDAGGISQTLYNIFSFCEPSCILCITDNKVYKKNQPTYPFKNSYRLYNFNIINFPANRFSKYYSKYIEWFNYSFNNLFRSFSKLKKSIVAFNPDVVITCSFSPVGIFMHHKLMKGIPGVRVIPYFMDDWMNDINLKWISGNLQNNVQKLLANNSTWLSISKNLAEILAKRYGTTPKNLLEIHNPVSLNDMPVAKHPVKKAEYSLAYAGALWDMHYDAFKTVAESVFELKKQSAINLVLYTTEAFWNLRKAELIPLQVMYGGSIPYSEIHQKLAEADALLLVSSFSQKWINHSKGSLQTKVTDYLKSQRLIISCGPSYSVNHEFLKEKHCGVCIETNSVSEVTKKINEVLNNIKEYQYCIENGNECLKDFSKEAVQNKLINFLEAVV